MPTPWGMTLAWLLMVIPLSVDQIWNLPVGSFDVRITYLGAALLSFWAAFRARSLGFSVRDFLRFQPWIYPWLGFALVGFLGALGSFAPTRSWAFWIWTMGTLIGVPWIVAQALSFSDGRGVKWPLRLLWVYLFVQAVVILVDLGLCSIWGEGVSIARVMVYLDAQAAPLCRPHAWYQEPGYYCGFALLSLVATLTPEGERSLGRMTWPFRGLVSVSIFVTTSRMGWLGLGVFSLALLLKFLKSQLRRGRSPSPRLMMGLSFSLLLVGFLVSQTSWWTTTWHHLGQAWSTNPLEDPSIRYRFWRVEAAWQVFREMPWVGAGPGGSGAYLVEHPEISDLKSHLTPESFEFLRRDPLSQNLFTELLSEWGVFGTLFFFWGLCSLLGVRRYSNWLGLAMLVVIYSASQTLARFDLWFMISVLAWLKRKV